MLKDRQVRKLRELLIRGETLSRAAWRTGMDRKTAVTYTSANWVNFLVREVASTSAD